MNTGKRQGHLTAFYVETLVLMVVLMVVALVLTQVFGLAKTQSRRAELLNSAVSLAESAAEAVAGADSPETLASLLAEGDNVTSVEGAAVTTLRAAYDTDRTPNSAGALWVEVTWQPTSGPAGTMVDSTITVSLRGEVLYTLSTAQFQSEVVP
jgi:type II secretory pathway pseudopilin PulG